MSQYLSPDPLDPPYVALACLQLPRPDASERAVCLSFQARRGAQRVTLSTAVDRYSPEWSILRAASEMMLHLEGRQEPITRERMEAAWRRSAAEYVAPF